MTTINLKLQREQLQQLHRSLVQLFSGHNKGSYSMEKWCVFASINELTSELNKKIVTTNQSKYTIKLKLSYAFAIQSFLKGKEASSEYEFITLQTISDSIDKQTKSLLQKHN
jgi:hypothetical protein